MNINSLMSHMPENADSALIVTPENRRYFTDFPSSDGILVVTRQGSIFFTDSRYIEAAQKTITCCEVAEGKKVYEQIRDFLNANNVKNIAVEQSGITLAQFENLKKNENLKAFELLSDNSLDKAISALRQVKSADEAERIKAAQRIAEKAFEHILDFIKVGRTEREIQLELDFFMLRNGAEALSFDTIAVSGVNSSMPHGVPSDKRIENGDFITMDFGAVVDGYHSDMTRTVAVGFVTDKQREVYETVLYAQENALSVLRAGVACADADKAARDVIASKGYGEFFGHGTGHGVGIEIHEKPNLSPRSDATLQIGNVVTVEPGIYLPSEFGVRIEDMALITENGYENLTKAEKSLIIL
ncbi:MAG: aminopeptidase P family protein [Clostridia bacterium]|nr:aminopeptidase P family protein [Clostridia bacterium]